MPRTLPGRTVKWRPTGCSDAIDGVNAFPGAMALLQNLVPSPTTPRQWVPRPAATVLVAMTANAQLVAPAQITALESIGPFVYGLVAETQGTFAGKDVPFCFHLTNNAFQPITIPGGAASLPVTQPNVGDWTPPNVVRVGSRIMISHVGYPGGNTGFFFGWLDITGLSSNTVTGNTHSSKTVDTLSANPITTAGWQVGDLVSSSAGDIPANTFITALTSASITLSNAATGSNNGVTLTVTGGTQAAPLYGAGNLNNLPFSVVPIAIGQFTGRAYYSVPPGTIPFSDPLKPCQATNTSTTQILSPTNGLDVTAFGGLGYYTTSGQGVLQSLICFQGDADIQSITGDLATSNLLLNDMSIGVGTLAPNTVCPTMSGLAFMATDGLRIINFAGQVSEPIGANGNGVCYPFLNAIAPSRMAASYNQNVYRITVQNGAKLNQPFEEWWYDVSLKVWHGPHTFPSAMNADYQFTPNHGFVLAPIGIPASIPSSLWLSNPVPGIADSYIENGATLSWRYQTVLLPDDDEMSLIKMVITTISMAIGTGQAINVSFLDETGAVIDGLQIYGANQPPTIWGSFTWGAPSLWGGPPSPMFQHLVPWHFPIIFRQGSLQMDGVSAIGTAIGNDNFQWEALGYVQPAAIQGVSASSPAPKSSGGDGSFPVVNP